MLDSTFNNVVFPHPEGPIIAHMSLSSDLKSIGPNIFFLSFSGQIA